MRGNQEEPQTEGGYFPLRFGAGVAERSRAFWLMLLKGAKTPEKAVRATQEADYTRQTQDLAHSIFDCGNRNLLA